MESKKYDAYWEQKDVKSMYNTFRHRAAIELLGSDGPVLDIGCGPGVFLEVMKGRNIDAVGTDISLSALKMARGINSDVIQSDVTSGHLPFKDGQFPIATVLDVIEHVSEPLSLLEEIGRVARELIVVAPNFCDIRQRIEVLSGRAPRNMNPTKKHCYWITYKGLKELIEQSGFSIVDEFHNFFGKRYPRFVKNLIKSFPGLFARSFSFKCRVRRKTGMCR
jgi:methionine biosynthesis protein MetW